LPLFEGGTQAIALPKPSNKNTVTRIDWFFFRKSLNEVMSNPLFSHGFVSV